MDRKNAKMPKKVSVDVTFHVDRFKTYDMLSQGTHRLKIRMWHEDSEGKVTQGYPVLIPEKKYIKRQKQTLFPPMIYKEEGVFTTRTFFIQYCDQSFDLNDMCVFRFDFDAHHPKHKNILIEVHLCCKEETEAGKKNSKNLDKDNFSSLTHSIFLCQNVCKSSHQYFPILFESYFFSAADCMVHTCPLKLYTQIVAQTPNVKQKVPQNQMKPNTTDLNQSSENPKNTSQIELLKLEIFGDDNAKIDSFLKAYNRTMTEVLRDQLIFIERLIALFESEKEKAKPEDTLAIESIKAQLASTDRQIPEYIQKFQIEDEMLSVKQTSAKKILQIQLEVCPNIPDEVKKFILSKIPYYVPNTVRIDLHDIRISFT